jgi:hypothetical protein
VGAGVWVAGFAEGVAGGGSDACGSELGVAMVVAVTRGRTTRVLWLIWKPRERLGPVLAGVVVVVARISGLKATQTPAGVEG